MALACLACSVQPATACSCIWEGPFLHVASRAEVILRARVVAHPSAPEKTPQPIEVEVLGVLRGDLAASTLRIWLDNGALCRPPTDRFPVGSEWILALNGPGSKVSAEERYAVSACGEYWLEVQDTTVVGNVDDARTRDARQAVEWNAFVRMLRHRLSS